MRDSFRRDINGLRAWAVIMVVLYHFDISFFGGGYIGVDVFFAISGYLMCGIVIERLQTSHFSFLEFYADRAKRIVPALVVLCLMLVIAGWFILPSNEYRQLGRQAIAALAFVSNILFWREKGYFDTESHEKLLLHTWSLSVEWQFYLIFPALLVLLWKWKADRRLCGYALAGFAAFSFLINCALMPTRAHTAFYLLPPRAWEMLAGGSVYALAPRNGLTKPSRQLFGLGGFLVVIASLLSLNDAVEWPGWRALFPVVGALMILAARNDSALTAPKLMQWVGNNSYSLYLWHWPVVVALRYSGVIEDAQLVALALVATLVLGHLSYRYVESTSGSYLRGLSKKRIAIAMALTCAAVAVPSLAISYAGAPARFPTELTSLMLAPAQRPVWRDKSCFLQDSQLRQGFKECGQELQGDGSRLLLWGDSYAAQLYPGITHRYAGGGIRLVQFTAAGCPPFVGREIPYHPNCKSTNDWTAQWIARERPSQVILAGHWIRYDWQNLAATIGFLKNNGARRIYLVGPVPEWQHNLLSILELQFLMPGTFDLRERIFSGMLPEVFSVDAAMRDFSRHLKIDYISATDILCNSGGCLISVPGATRPEITTMDNGHLTTAASKYVVSHFPSLLERP